VVAVNKTGGVVAVAAAGLLGIAGAVGVAANSHDPVDPAGACMRAPYSDDMRCVQVEPFPPRYLGAGVPMPKEVAAGVACEPVQCP
jgi:hypothetical protein